MKATVIAKFGFAQVGDVMHNIDTFESGDAWIGWLRTARRYEQFLIPVWCCASPEAENSADDAYHARMMDPETAHAELQRLGAKATERETAILVALRKRGTQGATSREAAALTGIPHVSTSTTMTKMVRKRMLADTDMRRDNAIVRIAIQYDENQGQLL